MSFRVTVQRGRIKFKRHCRPCEAEKQFKRDSKQTRQKESVSVEACEEFPKWTGPVTRPFVGFCLIDARGLVNLTTLDQEDMTCASNAR